MAAFTPPTITDDGVVSFTFDQSSPLFPSEILNFPINAQEKSFDNVFFGPSLDLNFNIVDGELSGDITISSAAQQGPFCDLYMHGMDGNWQGIMSAGYPGRFSLSPSPPSPSRSSRAMNMTMTMTVTRTR